MRNSQNDYKTTSGAGSLQNSKSVHDVWAAGEEVMPELKWRQGGRNSQGGEPSPEGGGFPALAGKKPYESSIMKHEASTKTINVSASLSKITKQNSKIEIKMIKPNNNAAAPVFFSDIMDMGDRIHQNKAQVNALDSTVTIPSAMNNTHAVMQQTKGTMSMISESASTNRGYQDIIHLTRIVD